MAEAEAPEARDTPQAIVTARRRISAAWLVPLGTLALAAWLGYDAWQSKGLEVRVLLADGHGLKAGDAVRYLGTDVGQVTLVEPAPGEGGIVVTARLLEQAERLARAGSRFWVVHPQLGLGGVEGLETLVGPRYLAVRPGGGAPQREFVGLRETPVVETFGPGDLEVLVTMPEKGALRRGAPVTYRQVRIGTVLSIGLASDGGGVEARVHVEQPFAQLVRPETVVWRTGGMEASVGLSGVTFELETLEQLMIGGLAIATPPDAGEVVRTGHRFELAGKAPEGRLQWQPLVVIGSEMLPPGAPVPQPLRARVEYRKGRWLARQKSAQGWVLQTERGLLGPADLLRPRAGDDGGDDEQDPPALEIAGARHPLGQEPTWTLGGLALMPLQIGEHEWSARRMRRPDEPEECVAIADPAAPPLPLAASRLRSDGADGWIVEPAVAVDDSWHGAAVVSREDGDVLGLLLVEGGVPRVALLKR